MSANANNDNGTKMEEAMAKTVTMAQFKVIMNESDGLISDHGPLATMR